MYFHLLGIGIYTSTSPFSLEGEGWDEGDKNGCFYFPHPNPLQQEREQNPFATHYVYNIKRLHCFGRRLQIGLSQNIFVLFVSFVDKKL